MKQTVLFWAMLALGACNPSEDELEKACYEKLSSDFDQYAITARSLGDHQGAVEARESALAVFVIFSDDDRNACDYVSAGPTLALDPSP